MANILKGLAATTIFGGSSLGAYVYQQRQLNIEEAKKRLDAEHVTLNQQLATVNTSITEIKAKMDHHGADAAERLEVMETLWADRIERYAGALTRSRDSLVALPEAVQYLAEVQQHCAHMVKYMPTYVQYDMTASRLHAFGLLAGSASRSVGIDGVTGTSGGTAATSITRNMDVYRSVLRGDPVVDLVVRLTAAPSPLLARAEKRADGGQDKPAKGDETGPKTYADLSKTFAKSRRYLSEAVEDYNARLAEERKAKEENERLERGEYIPFRPGTASQGAQTTLSVLRAADPAKVEESPAERRQREEADKAAELASYELRERKDVLAALLHCEHVRNDVRDKKTSSTSGWLTDPHVSRALQALDVWAAAAEKFLAEEQAGRVLRAISMTAQYPMVQVSQPPPGAQDGKGE
jgi:hypothetical protein